MSEGACVGDLVDLVRTKAAGVKSSADRYVGLEHIAAGGGLIGTAPASVSGSVNGVFEPGDVLFGKLRPYLRKSFQADFGGYASTDILILRPKPEHCPRFVKHAVTTDAVFTHADANSIGTRMPRTSWRAVAETPIWVPRLSEQWQIAEALETVDSAVAASRRLIGKLSVYRGAVLAAELRNLAAFEETTVAELAERVVVGIVVRPTQYYCQSGVPILRSANVRESGLQMSDLVFMSEADHRRNEKSRVQPGDLVTVRTGYPGTTAVVPDTVETANCVDIVVTRPRRDVVVPRFLALWVNSERGRGQVLRAQAGLAQQHFNVREMRAIRVPSVPLELQNAVVSRLEALDARLSIEIALAEKLRAVRTAISADLLTGRVRTVPA